MADYSEFALHDAAEETMNFGARAFGEDNLYETCTVATLSPSNEDDVPLTRPHIRSVIKGGKIFIAANARIIMLPNFLCSKIAFNHLFDSFVDCFDVTNDGKLLIVCERSGSVLAMNMETGETCKRKIVENLELSEQFFVGIFLENNTESSSFLIVDAKGVVSMISNIFNKEFIQDKIIDVESKVTVAAYSPKSKTLLMSGEKLVSYRIDRKILRLGDFLPIKSCHLYHTNKFIALLEDGSAILISTNLLTANILSENNWKCLEYAISNLEGYIVAMTQESSSKYEVIQFPEYKPIFSLNLRGDIHLICPENLNDEYLYIHNDSNDILRICSIYETAPVQRLQRLLKKGKYDDAEKFAKKFNLSMDEIHKARAQQLVEENTLNESQMSNLMDLLSTFDDVSYKLHLCLVASESCHNFADVQRILEYGCDLIIPKEKMNTDAEYQQEAVVDRMYLFETFMKLVNVSENMCCNIQSWIEFIPINMVSEVQRQLNDGQFEEAIILYSRFEDKEFQQLTDEDIKKMLQSLSFFTLSKYKRFLYTFIPITLKNKTQTVPIFINWLRQRIMAMEKSPEFPENAIDFANTMIGLLKLNSTCALDYDCDPSGSPKELLYLLDLLNMIQTLENNFDISVSILSMQNSDSLIHMFLTVQMETDKYEVFLKEFVIGYILKNNMLDPDEVFLEGIKDLIKYEEQYWLNTVPAILSVFKSVTLKFEAILIILEEVNPPWNATIRSLAKSAMTYDHPLVAQIKEQVENEPVQIVLRNPKYMIHKTQIIDLKMFTRIVERIIYCNEPSMENDINTTICSKPKWRKEAHLILAKHYVDLGNVEKAFTFVDIASKEDQIYLCKRLLSISMFKIDLFASCKSLTDGAQKINFWFEMYNSIMNRLQTLLSPDVYKRDTQNYQNIRTFFAIKKHFPECNVKLSDLSKNIKRDEYICDLLSTNFVENVASPKKMVDLIKACVEIAETTGQTSLSLSFLLMICERTENLHILVTVAEYLVDHMLDISGEGKAFCLIAILLMRNVGVITNEVMSQTKVQNQNMSFCVLEEDGLDVYISLSVRALQLAIKLSANALRLDYLPSVEVHRWMMNMVDLTTMRCESRSNTSQLWKHVYNTKAHAPTVKTFNTIRELFLLYTGLLKAFNDPSMEILTYYTKSYEIYTMETFAQELEELETHINSLYLEHHYFTGLHVVGSFQNLLSYAKEVDTEIPKMFANLSRKCNEEVLKNIFMEQHLDVELAFSLLIQHDAKYSFKTISCYTRVFKRNFQKITDLSELGLRLTAFYKNDSMKDICINMKKRAKWICVISNCNIALKTFFTIKPDQLLQQLIAGGYIINLKILTEYCADFGLVPSEFYENYIQKTLINWRPEMQQVSICDSKNTVPTINSEKAKQELLDKCMEVVSLNEIDLVDTINNLWGSINFYYYEVFLCIISILESIDIIMPDYIKEKSKQKALLHFLQGYTRVSKPGENELQEFFKKFPEAQAKEPLSEWRLPFTSTLFSPNIMKILKPEINLATYKKWFTFVDEIDEFLTKDDFCCYVVKSVVSSEDLQKGESKDWNLQSVHADLISNIADCVSNIKNLEVAINVLYHLTIHTPPGADLVKVAELCYSYACKLRETANETAENVIMFEKVKNKYFSCRVNQILYTYQLAKENYLQLIFDPNELIESIYLDPRILNAATSITFTCPDINRAATEISSLYDIDIFTKQLALIETWLFDGDSVKLNCSQMITNGQSNDSEEAVNNNFKRACYIFMGENIIYWQDYLVAKGMPTEDSTQNDSHLTKARALKCFYTISSIEKIESITGYRYAELKNYVDKLFLLSDMESSGYRMSVEELEEMNKILLLKRLTRYPNKETTRIMAAISTTYTISDLKCWEYIVNKMVEFKEYEDLKQALSYLKASHVYKYKRFYINGWQFLFEHAINGLKHENKSTVDSAFVDIMLMIQCCPVLSNVNFNVIVDCLVQLRRWEYIAVLIQYTNQKSKIHEKELITMILSHCPNIIAKLEQYADHGILVSTATQTFRKYTQ